MTMKRFRRGSLILVFLIGGSAMVTLFQNCGLSSPLSSDMTASTASSSDAQTASAAGLSSAVHVHANKACSLSFTPTRASIVATATGQEFAPITTEWAGDIAVWPSELVLQVPFGSARNVDLVVTFEDPAQSRSQVCLGYLNIDIQTQSLDISVTIANP